MKTVYTTRISFSTEVDPSNPDQVAAAATYMKKLAAGDITAPPDGMKVSVDVGQAPTIMRRK